MTTTCTQAAAALRLLASAIEQGGEKVIVAPFVNFSCRFLSSKEQFLNLVSVLPRPLKKKVYEEDEFRLVYDTPDITVWATANRNEVCTLIEPAKPAVYSCEPLLSDAELSTF